MKKIFSLFKFEQQPVWLMGIFVLTAILRFYQLGTVPAELNRDEASLGYTAYSLLKTGHEEHGTSWPIQIESFGDWKLPLYVYTLIPIVKIFGLTPWAVRLPSALAGISVVVSSYFLVRLLFKEKRIRQWLQLLVPLSLAVSPWAVHFSHVAYEAHLSVALFLWGLVGLLVVLRDFKQGSRRIALLILSQYLWAVTLLGYHAYQVFIPLFWLVIGFIYRDVWQQFFIRQKSWLIAVTAPFLLVFGILLVSGVGGANSTKFSGLSIFDVNSYTKQVTRLRMATPNPNNPVFSLAANKFGAIFTQLETNVLQLISPEFLFLRGGANHAHNVTGFGNFYPIMIIGLMSGVIFLVIRYKKQPLLLSWLLAASIAPLLTFQANHTVRFSPAFMAIEIISVYGFIELFQITKKYFSRRVFFSLVFIVVMGLSYNAYRFLVHYYFIFPKTAAEHWSWQMKDLASYLSDEQELYEAIYLQDEKYSPYIYFLFHWQVDPATLADRLEYYPVDEEGFRHARRLDNIYFQQIDWHNQSLYEGKNVLFVVEERQIPDFNRFNEHYQLLTTFKNPWVSKGVEVWRYQGVNSLTR